jgi:hypothetical protein
MACFKFSCFLENPTVSPNPGAGRRPAWRATGTVQFLTFFPSFFDARAGGPQTFLRKNLSVCMSFRAPQILDLTPTWRPVPEFSRAVLNPRRPGGSREQEKRKFEKGWINNAARFVREHSAGLNLTRELTNVKSTQS